MRRYHWKAAALGLGMVAAGASGRVEAQQAQPQVDQAQQVQRVRALQSPQSASSVPSLYSGEEDDTGSQVILGEGPQRRWNWFNLNLDEQYFHTSNAFLSTTDIKSTWLLVSTIDAELEIPPISVPNGNLFTQVGYQYQWFDYGIGGNSDNFSNLDFDVSTVYAVAQYALPDNLTIFGNLSYTRLLNDGNGFDEFYKELVPSISVQKSVKLSNTLLATVEYSGNYRFTDEVPYPNQSRGCNDRTDEALALSLTWQVTPKVDIRPFYRFQYSYFPDFIAGRSRNDFLHTLGLSSDYYFNSWSSVRVFLTYELLDTDASTVGDYRKFDVGGGASVGLKF